MAKDDIAAVVALSAALFFAIGNVIQQRSAHDVEGEQVGHLELFMRLLRDRQWWSGSVAVAVGTGLQVVAIGLGSVLLVEALLVTSLLFSLPIKAHRMHTRVRRSVWPWAVLLTAADVVVVVIGNPTAGQAHASLRTWLSVVAVAGPVLLLCLLVARARRGRVAAVLLAVVSGTAWGVFAVLTKGVVDLVVNHTEHGPGAVLASPELYGWLVAALVGTIFQQSSFHSGALTASLPTMMLAEPLVAAALSVALLGEALRTGPAGRLAVAVALVAMIVAIVALSRTEAVEAGAAGDTGDTGEAGEETADGEGDDGGAAGAGRGTVHRDQRRDPPAHRP